MSEELINALGGGGAQMPNLEANMKALRDYAQSVVDDSGTGMGVTYDTGVLFVGYKNLPDSKLVVRDSVKKIYKIADNMGTVPTGKISASRILINPPAEFGMIGARQISQQYKLDNNELPDVEKIVDSVSEIMSQYDKNRLRGMGLDVALIIGGINVDGDEKPKLYTIDVEGDYAGYRATAIGRHEDKITRLFEQYYEVGEMTLESAKELAFDALVSNPNEDKDGNIIPLIPDNIECSVIDEGSKYRALNDDEIKELFDTASYKLKI